MDITSLTEQFFNLPKGTLGRKVDVTCECEEQMEKQADDEIKYGEERVPQD